MKYTDNYEIDYSNRKPGQDADELFYKRWSPRSFQKEELPCETIKTIIAAAHWTQSAFNEQPWRFLTSTKDTFDKFLNLLVERNQMWAKNASVLGFIIAKKHFSQNDKNNRWANFDSGAAWMGLTLQARKLGLYTHGMAGIKRDEVYSKFGIDKERYRVICAFALGIIDKPEKLEKSFQKDEKPSARKTLEEVWKIGSWEE
ncbi:MAG: nitroreductase family protein [Candidatus Cloacimonetes bacterium]|nr:nitroreductase family protein [Candidatus Cloacimonadota bacterium]MCF7814274.1 nitroreductase family protein [Candidatus Cloacimonadota bacterium]MCF7868935.1 nitroreductase family protein [Candidatus Cloacimonadota bacterium]MCF7884315.1 nitroreductase family protein [Candidatus Cloacimonadota bacterium]